MPKVFIHFTFFFFVLTAVSGVWMRAIPFFSSSTLPYTNILHAHSHIAILGWTFTGVFIVFLTILWPTIKQPRQAVVLLISLFITSFLMFIAFLYQGYGIYSIILSVVHIFVEYWTAVFIYRESKAQRFLPSTVFLFIKGSLLTLVISSIGPFSLGYISAAGLNESYISDMAIYFYLHFQYNGWLYLILIGLFLLILHSKKIPVNQRLLTFGFWLYFISLFPGYFLSILWVDNGGIYNFLATAGSIGQWVAILCTLLAFTGSRRHVRKSFSTLTIVLLSITFSLLFAKSTMELGLISPTLASLIYDTRSIIIGYLHFTLLGFVSIFILAQYQMVHLLTVNTYTIYGFALFLTGFVLNELFLFSHGLMQWLRLQPITFHTQGLFASSLLLLTGITLLWISRCFNKNS
ncbi:hypothetical protein QGM71_09065 [Virgibacillus sp. C22-A2]|uniref:Uncharacterized protein n=1 Tax=Virgibacillus tibetensis TaxID=3042313 RepID=A0ABU6KEN0_9BACI|nr:hypothetical protein [Virgibacillus sp. C22-A2]